MAQAEKGLSGGRFPGINFRYPKVGGKEALDYIKRLSKNVNWEAYSDRPLEFLYLGDEVEELISDEAEQEVIAQCAWQQLTKRTLLPTGKSTRSTSPLAPSCSPEVSQPSHYLA